MASFFPWHASHVGRRLLLTSTLFFVGRFAAVTAAEPPSSPAAAAMAEFTLPAGMTMRLVAAEPQVENPVAFCLDEQGRIFVCETFRQGKGVEDNRGHGDWLETDLSLHTVDERVAMFRHFLGEKVSAYAEQEDRIRLLTDTDGDGVSDQAVVFAGGFRGIEEGTGAGVLAIDGDVYYTCIPRLWRLRDVDGDGIADERTILQDGYGVRVAFRGHDLHGLTLGHDGRIYFSIGDRGYHVVTADGRRVIRPETGAVFRCERDGSGLEEFAFGLRNPQELVFDDFGNLFTADNNSDSGDKARWVHVVEGGDSGWRMHFQYLPDRGPWNRERRWYPHRHDEETARLQPAAVLPPVAHLGDGPAGLAAYPGLGLPDQFAGHFFLADFRGSRPTSGIRTVSVQPQGAGFTLVDGGWFIKGVLATDVDFGYDGRVYLSDWVEGWNGPGKGRLYAGTMPESSAGSDLSSLFRQGFAGREEAELAPLLGHADRRVRQRAQFALVDRGASARLTTMAADTTLPLRPRLHAIWGLGQLLRQGSTGPEDVRRLLADEQAEIRRQAAMVLGDSRQQDAIPDLVGMLARPHSAAEQAAAAIALARIARQDRSRVAAAIPALITLLADNDGRDAVLRHAACFCLAAAAPAETLAALVTDSRTAVRLGAVVALARQQGQGLAAFLEDEDQQVVAEAARAIHDEAPGDELPALAAIACREGLTDAARRRAMNAAFRIGGIDQADRIARLAAESTLADPLRLEAIEMLSLWQRPPALDRVTNAHRPLPERSATDVNTAVTRHFAGMLVGPPEVRERAVALLADTAPIAATGPLTTIIDSPEEPATVRAAAVRAVGRLNQAEIARRMRTLLRDPQAVVRQSARDLLGTIDPKQAVQELAVVFDDGDAVEQQAAIESLQALKSATADAILVAELKRQAAGTGQPAILLDLLLAAQARGTPDLLAAAADLDARRDPADPLAPWRECLTGGDPRAGKKVFHEHAAASCLRCHQVQGKGGAVGPDLSAIGASKPAAYLLESLVHPSAAIAQGFATVQFLLHDGQVMAGIIREETADAFRVITPEAKELVIAKADVDEATSGLSAMPADIARQLTKREVRDLVAYLGTLKHVAAAAGHPE